MTSSPRGFREIFLLPFCPTKRAYMQHPAIHGLLMLPGGAAFIVSHAAAEDSCCCFPGPIASLIMAFSGHVLMLVSAP